MASRLTRTATLAGVIALVAAAPAGAQAKPSLGDPCTTSLFTDARGDQAGLIGSAPESTDIVAGFFSYDADDNLVANLQVADLTKDVPFPYSGISWLLNWMRGDTEYYVQASTDGAEVFYTHGTREGSQLTEAGSTTGTLFEGADGIVQLVVPESIAPEGEELTQVYGRATVDAIVLLFSADDAPDEESTVSHTPVRCAPPAPAPAPPAPAAGAGKLDVKVSPSTIRASKARRGVKLTLSTASPLTKVRLTLRKGRRTVAGASLSKLSGRRTVTLKRRAKLTPGTHTLSVVAAEGRRTYRIRVRK